MRNRSICIAVMGVLLAVLVSVPALAEGFRNPPDGAATMGRGGVRMTRGDGPAAINNNPANLMDMKRAQVMPSVTIGYARTEYTSPSGVREETEDPWRMLPSVYAAWPEQAGRYTFGFGLNVPYGQSTEWSRNGVFQWTAPYFAEMSALTATPAMAVKLSESVAVGLGINLMWAELELEQRMPAGLMGPASEVKLEGDGYGLGAKAGLTWQVTDRQRIALTYKSPVNITYEGDSAIRSLPPGLELDGDFETELRFPTEVGLGYGIELTDRLRVEANIEWVEHSRNEAITIESGTTASIPQDWDDVWVVGLGGDLQLTDRCVLRAGWMRMPTPVPSRTLMPTLPEGDNNIFGIGLGVNGENNTLDLGYVISVFKDRTIANNINPSVNGEYEFESHLILLSYTRSL